MTFTKPLAMMLVTNALGDKRYDTGAKAFINTSRPASKSDLLALRDRICKGETMLVKAYKDNRGYWHFITTA